MIHRINKEVNLEACETTKIPRITLFKKEKEYLRPLPSKLVLESYVKDVRTQTVPSTLLVRYKGNGYSVPKKFIGKRVKIVPIQDELYVYYNSDLIAIHKITQNPMNYKLEDYKDALRDHLPKKIADADVTKQAENNLKLLGRIGQTESDLGEQNDAALTKQSN